MADTPFAPFGIRIEFYFFALTLIGVALFHHHTLKVALTGLVVITGYKLFCTDFDFAAHFFGSGGSEGEWGLMLNLLGLLVGFGLLAKHFEESRLPEALPRWLPDDWKGGFVLLLLVAFLSSFLDNIAAAMIGGTVAKVVFGDKVHLGYLAAIVAASNAGGAGSVVGDTTTTMMWLDGVDPLDVTHAFVGAIVALLFFGVIAARQQDRHQRIHSGGGATVKVDTARLLIVALILAGAIFTNVVHVHGEQLGFPALGVWVALLLSVPLRAPAWREIPGALRGAAFLLSLVWCASLMPVEELPAASWRTTLGLGFVSAVFDNIPLTKLALDQGGYDWGFLAYAVGFGGSMIWFGSSAGVALCNSFPEGKSVFQWVKSGWHVGVGYVLGFAALYFIMGWHPHEPHASLEKAPAVEQRDR
ncbi:MAG TPA: citrate transporter [Planctomycetota bacterium]|nr:citrate transporter [Planctomycetota bacterium]